MSSFHAMLDLAVDGLRDLANADVVFAKPVVINDKQIIPVLALSVGFYGMGGEGEGEGQPPANTKKGSCIGKGKGTGSIAAGGARLIPIAVVVKDKNGIRVLKVPKKKKGIEKLFEKIPGLVEKIQQMEKRDKS